MEKKGSKRRVYTPEFKTEAVALVRKGEKPVSQVAKDLGVNESLLRKWEMTTRVTAGPAVKAFPGHGRPRDEELTRLRKENRSLKEANEILKKAAFLFAQREEAR